MAGADGAAFGQWLAQARAQARQPPAAAREPFWVAGRCVGSVPSEVMHEIRGLCLSSLNSLLIFQEQSSRGWHLQCTPGDATSALNLLARALQAAGRCGPWRDEQLAVLDAQGLQLATVERGAARVLGLATRAVHLVGTAPDGRVWVQQRAFTKPNDPGLWDTLMGGMVAASDTLEQAVARETWEEAGLLVQALSGLRHGGCVEFSRPSHEGGGAGYMRERIEWFHAVVPAGMAPCNQDGEVERFDLLTPQSLREQVAQGRFTLEAGLVIAAFFGH
ncbi:MAG: NUDIX hydrolase [Burkholderiaceae bacterium]